MNSTLFICWWISLVAGLPRCSCMWQATVCGNAISTQTPPSDIQSFGDQEWEMLWLKHLTALQITSCVPWNVVIHYGMADRKYLALHGLGMACNQLELGWVGEHNPISYSCGKELSVLSHISQMCLSTTCLMSQLINTPYTGFLRRRGREMGKCTCIPMRCSVPC